MRQCLPISSVAATDKVHGRLLAVRVCVYATRDRAGPRVGVDCLSPALGEEGWVRRRLRARQGWVQRRHAGRLQRLVQVQVRSHSQALLQEAEPIRETRVDC